ALPARLARPEPWAARRRRPPRTGPPHRARPAHPYVVHGPGLLRARAPRLGGPGPQRTAGAREVQGHRRGAGTPALLPGRGARADTRRLRSAVAGFAVAAVEQDPARGRAGALPRQLRLRNVRDDDGAAGFPSPGGEDGGRTGARRPRQPPWT